MAVITIAHTKGGVGKSMIAWNLAGALNGTILDLDFQQTLSRNNELRARAGMKPFKVLEINSEEEFLNAVKASSLSEYIIIDTGGFDDNLVRRAIISADIIITPALENNSEVFGLKTFGRILNDLAEKINEATKQNGVDDYDFKIQSFVLLNRIHHNTCNFKIIKAICDENPHFTLMDTIIRDRSIYRKTFNMGQTIYESGNMQGIAEFNALKKEIKKRITNAIKEAV